MVEGQRFSESDNQVSTLHTPLAGGQDMSDVPREGGRPVYGSE